MGKSVTRALVVVCPFVLLSWPAVATAQEISRPTDLLVQQIGYGVQPEVILSWSNQDLYDAVVVAIDDDIVPATIDGVRREATIPATLGTHVFTLRGQIGEDLSSETTATFEVLRDSPVGIPITDSSCEFLDRNGGELHLEWSSGASEWVLGRLEIPRFLERFEVSPGATSAILPALGGRPYTVLLRFLDADGYFSEPIVEVCQVLTPAFRRGDCNSSGRVNLVDVIFLLNTLFLGTARGSCDDACDSNDDSVIDISDGVTSLIFLFQKGPPPSFPGAKRCGVDLTEDFLGGTCVCP